MKKLPRIGIILSLVACSALQCACGRGSDSSPALSAPPPPAKAKDETPSTPVARQTCFDECKAIQSPYCFSMSTDAFIDSDDKSLYKISSSLKENEVATLVLGKKSDGTFKAWIEPFGKSIDLQLKVEGLLKVRRVASRELKLSVLHEDRAPQFSSDDNDFNSFAAGPLKGIEFVGANPIFETQPSDSKAHECIYFHAPN